MSKHYPITESLGLTMFYGSEGGDWQLCVDASELEALLMHNRGEPGDFGLPETDKFYILRPIQKLKPLTKAEMLAVFEDFKNPKSQYTQPQIAEMVKRLTECGVAND